MEAERGGATSVQRCSGQHGEGVVVINGMLPAGVVVGARAEEHLNPEALGAVPRHPVRADSFDASIQASSREQMAAIL